MKAKSRILSIAISVLMILSMFVCGIDQTAFALENEGNVIANTNDTNEVSEDGDEVVEETPDNENTDAGQTGDEETEGDVDEGEKPGLVQLESDEAGDDSTEKDDATRTIMLYCVGSNLETDGGLASYNLRQVLASKFSDDEDVRFIVMTGGSHEWQLEQEYLDFGEINVPEDAVTEYDTGDLCDRKSKISNNYNQIWEAKGADATAENAGKMVLVDGNGITGEDGEAVKSVDELMSDPDTLKAFINYGVENYPADKYDLILWDHGGGPDGGFGADEHVYDTHDINAPDIMSFEGIVEALADNSVTKDGGKFDFIDFDACLMSSVELALAMADYTDYYIASADSEPGYGQFYGPAGEQDGQTYTGWLDVLGEHPDYDTFDLGKVIVDDFYKFYEKESGDGASQDGTLAVIDTKKMMDSQFVDTLDEMVRLLKGEAANVEEDGIHFYDELKSYSNSIEYSGYELFDLGQVAALLSVVNSEVSEKDLDKDDDYYINCNSYHDISRTLIKMLDSSSEESFIYARGTSGISSKENYYRTKDDTMGHGALGTSGMSIYFPGKEMTLSAINYFKSVDPVIERMKDSDSKQFMKDYEAAVSYYSLILFSGRTVEALLNESDFEDQVSGKDDVDYDLFMDYFKDGTYSSVWDELAVPAIEKIARADNKDASDTYLDEWFEALVPQLTDDAIDSRTVTIDMLGEDEDDACKVTVNDAKKRVIESVERRIYAEIPTLDKYKRSLPKDVQMLLESGGHLYLGSVKGTLENPPEGTSVADTINWYNESGGIWNVEALGHKWYAVNDADGDLHVASLYLADEDGYVIPALIGTKDDGPDEDRMIFLEFSYNGGKGDQHELTAVWFVDMETGPVKAELQDLTRPLTVTPIMWIRPFMSPTDYFAPLSDPFVLSKDNAGSISLDYVDIDKIEDIKDINNDGEALYSKLTINDIFGYPLDITKGVDIRHVRVKPGIYTGEELVPEVVYKGETLEPGVDYIWEKEATDYTDDWEPIVDDFIEPGDYLITLMGKGRFKGDAYDVKFTIVLPEEEAQKQVEEAKEKVEEAQEAVDALDEDSTDAEKAEAYKTLAEAQKKLVEAQEVLSKTKDVLSKEKQAELEDEVAKLEDQVKDLTEQLGEAQVVDISYYAATLAGTSFEYTGKAIEPAVTVPGLGAEDYTVKYENNTNIGTAKVIITAKGDKYKGTINKTFVITKRTNTLTAKGKTATVKKKVVKKKAKKLAVKKVIKFSNKGQGALTYKKASGNKKITINKKNGKVTVKKGLKKGTYKVKVNITAVGNATYKAVTKTVTFKVKVK